MSDDWQSEYASLRLLPNGKLAGVKKMLFTTALVVGLDENGYETRFCFDSPDQWAEALASLAAWDGEGWPPGYWLKQKPENVPNPIRKETSTVD